MAKNGEIKYENQTAKVVRGLEAKKIEQMQKEGWELLSQRTGRVLTELTFQRVKKPAYTMWIAISGLVGIAVLCLTLAAIFGDENEPESKASSPSSSNTPSVEATRKPSDAPSEGTPKSTEPSAKPSSAPAEKPSEEPKGAPPGDAVLTVKNSPDLKAMLNADDDYDLNEAFAEKYEGRSIQFDGSVADATPGYYLVYFGDDSNTNGTSGPAFQFQVEILSVDGREVTPGDNLRFTATVESFNPMAGLFYLSPLEITER